MGNRNIHRKGPPGFPGRRGGGGPTGYSGSCSSRVYKKNIKPWTDLEKAIEEIVETPLFTYQYKEDHPNKTRYGVISEELPAHLQILSKDAPSTPDWLSIYGTLWAGIKVLAKWGTNFKEKAAGRAKQMALSLKEWLTNQTAGLKKELTAPITDLQNQTAEFQTKLRSAADSADLNRREAVRLEKRFQTTLRALKTRQKEVEKLREDLKKARKKLEEILSDPTEETAKPVFHHRRKKPEDKPSPVRSARL